MTPCTGECLALSTVSVLRVVVNEDENKELTNYAYEGYHHCM